MVNLVFKIGKYARLNLPAELDNGDGSVRARVTHRKDIDWMVGQELVGVPCRVEFPDKACKRAVFQSVSESEKGFVLSGRFISRSKQEER
jgi:hypothetical protein